ncbi:hypothetical protein [Microlunatus soli]|uniref:Uncharacterized protein n=1 Tax=Microlunatus soli TaxID=630515 RepID=A0A1H1R6I0_9ACTN|nr:hypothetical protein [Microlunatus soli]SDS31341.1 hypothetical protein SAMN04489812_1528 [Microlunatus soli]
MRPDGPAAPMEWPVASVVFLDRRTVLAEYGVLSDAATVRTPSDGDRRLTDPLRLTRWLGERGIGLG